MSCAQCFENPPVLSSPAGAGHVEELAGLKTYITGSPDSNLAVLLLADAFGFEAPKLRKFADRVASAGFLVVVPDFFYGDAVDPEKRHELDRDAWLKSHSPDKGSEDAVRVIMALKSKGVSAVGAAGFCWGGMTLAKLAGLDDLQAAVILHPGEIPKDDIRAIKIPTAILGAEHDHIFPAAELKKFEELLAAKSEVECYVKIFPGVAHGWSIRFKDEDEFALQSAEEAQQETLDWLVKHVKSQGKQ
ncbi:hypothetical protein MLD38_027362 [Melastoma candidum]|uniref:Uncharacterized protein n=1 Tax=Melastoma candidum TaxID=119954 RepID=A0ACB9P1B6_9MYRT|nr:hypothetical protein MLD38_027362 [Melastoma candidum]